MCLKVKKAFTFLEVTLVIIVLGILALLTSSRIDRDLKQEAIDNIVSAIRYTQHLAVMGVKIDNTEKTWQRTLWRFAIEGCSDEGIFYAIGTDLNRKGNISKFESAKDPHSGLPLNGLNFRPCAHEVQNNVASDIFISKHYGILEKDIDWKNCPGNVKHIAFDHMGRLYRKMTHTGNNYRAYMEDICKITFSISDSAAFSIIIQPETGMVTVEKNLDI